MYWKLFLILIVLSVIPFTTWSAAATPLSDILLHGSSCKSIAEAALATRGLEFRFATSADHTELQTMITRVRMEFIKDHSQLENTFDSDLVSIDESYNQNESQLFVITNSEGRILGSGGFFRTSAVSAEIRKIYFSKEIRGKKLSQPWFDFIASQAEATGVERLWLVNHHDLSDATRLYFKEGFELFVPDRSEYSVPLTKYYYFQRQNRKRTNI